MIDVESVAARLLGRTPDRIEHARASGNNRLYRVEAGGAVYALKSYPRTPGDSRDRLGAEWGALRFLEAHGVANVPRPIACEPQADVALYSWIEGEPVGEPGTDDIDAVVAFATRLKHLSKAEDAAALPPASEACLSGAELVRQVRARAAKLQAIENEPSLAAFLADAILPALERHAAVAATRTDDLPYARRTISPSDFGFHNALRTPAGLIFLDFEYFGWDDPVKLAADFLLHPGMNLAPARRNAFLAGIVPIFSEDDDFLTRLGMLYPLYALRWVMIVLNEFLPERWARRQAAGAGEWEDAKRRQLAKAIGLMARLQDMDQ